MVSCHFSRLLRTGPRIWLFFVIASTVSFLKMKILTPQDPQTVTRVGFLQVETSIRCGL